MVLAVRYFCRYSLSVMKRDNLLLSYLHSSFTVTPFLNVIAVKEEFIHIMKVGA